MEMERIMILSEIKAHKERDVSTVDVLGDYLHTDNNEYVIMLLRRWLAELVAMVDKMIYQKYVTTY